MSLYFYLLWGSIKVLHVLSVALLFTCGSHMIYLHHGHTTQVYLYITTQPKCVYAQEMIMYS